MGDERLHPFQEQIEVVLRLDEAEARVAAICFEQCAGA